MKLNHYYIEELNESMECIDLSLYSVVIIIDPEKEFTNSELKVLKYFYEEMNLSLFIVSEWNKEFLKSAIQLNDNELMISNNPSTW
jgi:hypothetical protein